MREPAGVGIPAGSALGWSGVDVAREAGFMMSKNAEKAQNFAGGCCRDLGLRLR